MKKEETHFFKFSFSDVLFVTKQDYIVLNYHLSNSLHRFRWSGRETVFSNKI